MKTRRIFCSYSPLRMRSAFGKKSEHFFEKISSHFTTEDLRAVWAKKRKTFLKIFCSHSPLESNCLFGRKLWKFSFLYSSLEMEEAF